MLSNIPGDLSLRLTDPPSECRIRFRDISQSLRSLRCFVHCACHFWAVPYRLPKNAQNCADCGIRNVRRALWGVRQGGIRADLAQRKLIGYFDQQIPQRVFADQFEIPLKQTKLSYAMFDQLRRYQPGQAPNYAKRNKLPGQRDLRAASTVPPKLAVPFLFELFAGLMQTLRMGSRPNSVLPLRTPPKFRNLRIPVARGDTISPYSDATGDEGP